MLDEATRTAVLKLTEKGHGTRRIARALSISRGAVREVIKSGQTRPPMLTRTDKGEEHREEILELVTSCRGNLVRVHEELLQKGASLSYPALTSYCRRNGIGYEKEPPVGQYDLAPGQEMQHDTSPHRVVISGKTQLVQTASLVLGYSRMLFFQHYPTFNRFYCKVFLTDALTHLGGACRTCVIDNTHVVVYAGSGRTMVVSGEMEAFAERFGFVFRAHEIGDPNRKGKVERSFHTIENNFLCGRVFESLGDLNEKAIAYCDKVNASFKRHLQAAPRELFQRERPQLVPLPVFVPEVYQLHHRLVDVEGYVTVSTHRYSVPYQLIGRQLEVRETKSRLEVYDGPRRVASHERVFSNTPTRMTLDEHRPPRRSRTDASQKSKPFAAFEPYGEEVLAYARAVRMKHPGLRGTLLLRRLLSFCREYPQKAVRDALERAFPYGLFDMERLEKLILSAVRREYFVLPEDVDEEP